LNLSENHPANPAYRDQILRRPVVNSSNIIIFIQINYFFDAAGDIRGHAHNPHRFAKNNAARFPRLATISSIRQLPPTEIFSSMITFKVKYLSTKPKLQ
jgi:hypothetical protein